MTLQGVLQLKTGSWNQGQGVLELEHVLQLETVCGVVLFWQDDDSSDEEDDTAELLAELNKIKKERAQEQEERVCYAFVPSF